MINKTTKNLNVQNVIILQKQRNLFYWNASSFNINLTSVDEKISYLYGIDISDYLNKFEKIKNEKKNSIYELRLFIKHGVNEYESHYFAFYRTNVWW